MRHPSEGTLRRLLDEPAGVADADREHVAGCPVCLAGLARAREDAAMAGAALRAETTTDPDPDQGWRRLSHTIASDRRRPAAPAARRTRWRSAVRSPVVAVVAVVALLTGAGAAAATDWFQVFRTDQVAPVTITHADLIALPDLSAYGEVEVVERPNLRTVDGPAAAQEATGLSVPEVADLPEGVTGAPTYQVGDPVTALFTFSTAKATQAAETAGETLPPPPAGLDGSQFRLVAGPGVAAIWSSANDLPALIVARATAPTAYSSGVPFETARDYLLSLPGMPEDLAAQLRSFSGDGTLPLPVPAGVQTNPADVGGAPATVLTTPDGMMAGVVWVEDGIITAVAGSLSTDEVLSVARGLR